MMTIWDIIFVSTMAQTLLTWRLTCAITLMGTWLTSTLSADDINPSANILHANRDSRSFDTAAATSLHVEAEDGSYQLLLDSGLWLKSAPTTVSLQGREYSSADGSLVLKSSRLSVGSDGFGDYNSTILSWMASNTSFTTEFRQYVSTVLFLQTFPQGAATGSTSDEQDAYKNVFAQFPAFVAEVGDVGTRGYANWHSGGVPNKPWMTSIGSKTLNERETGVWPPAKEASLATSLRDKNGEQIPVIQTGWEAVGALAIFDRAGNSTTVLSPVMSFDTTNIGYSAPKSDGTGGVLFYGPRASISSVPAGFTSGVIISAGSGIRQSMRQWGLKLMHNFGKDPDLWKDDFSLKYLGYTTDNGAYYYYNTEPGTNYETTILDLKAYTVQKKIPIRWILYDSWFYSKSNDTGHGMMDPAHGCLNWSDADPKIFPSGLRYMYDQTNWPVVAHARAWAKDNVYATQNGGKYDFVEGVDLQNQTIALPMTSSFWDDLFADARQWGCLQYQQDWMYTQAGQDNIRVSATLGKQWRMQMTNALTLYGMRFGFGGVQGADWLTSVEQQAVTNGRISDDYHANLTPQLGAENWDIGVASIFGWALSVIPAKDGYWTTPEQPGHPYKDNRTEPYGALHSAVATLSRGPVSPADKIGLFNRDMIMRSCMDDGTLLQPDIPARSLDQQLVKAAFGQGGPEGGVWTTYSTITDLQYHHILVPMLYVDYNLTVAELTRDEDTSLQGHTTVVLENAMSGSNSPSMVGYFGMDSVISIPACDQSTFKLFHTIPILENNWGYAGELQKWIPVSAARTRSVSVISDEIMAELSGTSNETIDVTFVHADGKSAPVMSSVRCSFPASGLVQVTPKGCTPL